MIRKLLTSIIYLLSIATIAQTQLTSENTNQDFGAIGSNQPIKPNTGFLEFNNKFFFYAKTPNLGNEIWYSDGTENNTKLLKDISEGITSSNPIPFFNEVAMVFNNQLFFLSQNSLWKSNGTENGTIKIKDIEEERPFLITPLSDTDFLFFTINDNDRRISLWKSNGTETNTIKILNNIGDNFFSHPLKFIKANNIVYFIENSRIWSTDGTAENSYSIELKDLDSRSISIESINNTLYILGKKFSTSTYDLNILDTTKKEIILIKSFDNLLDISFKSSFNSTSLNGKIYFSLLQNPDNPNKKYKYSVIESDGTIIGTIEKFSLESNIADKLFSNFIAVGSNIYFTSQNTNDGLSLFSLNQTTGITEDITEILPSSLLSTTIENSSEISQNLYNIKVFDNNKIFISQANTVEDTSDTSSSRVWITNLNGNINEIKNLKGVLDIFEFNNKLFFPKFSKGIELGELWTSDGTNKGTIILNNINTSIIGLTERTRKIIEINNNLLYVNNENFYSLNVTTEEFSIIDTPSTNDYTIAGTFDDSSTVLNNEIYFAFNKLKNLRDLLSNENEVIIYKTNGTKNNSSIVSEIPFTQKNRYIASIFSFNDKLYFLEYHTENSTNSSAQVKAYLTSYDGTNYSVVKDFGEKSIFRFFSPPLVKKHFTNDLFYISINPISSSTPVKNSSFTFSSDGTEQGTTEYNIYTKSSSVFKNELYFSGNTFEEPQFGKALEEKLFKVNNTTKKIEEIKNINNNSNDDNIYFLNSTDDTLFFTAMTETSGSELWKTDGTKDGTILIKDINPGTQSSIDIDGLQFFGYTSSSIIDSQLYFVANDGIHGNELWRSNGFETGTTLVKDINPGPKSSLSFSPFNQSNNFVNIGDSTYFIASPSAIGELWKSDGTSEGTELVLNFSNSNRLNFINKLTTINNQIYFPAHTNITGRQLWRFNPTSITLSTNDIDLNNRIFIFPIPTKDIIFFPTNKKISNIALYNINGSIALSNISIVNNEISIEKLAPNIYILTYEIDGIKQSQKIIKL